jgi:hypothetical protein
VTLSFRFDEADWLAFIEHHYNHSPTYRRFRALACAMPVLAPLFVILYRWVQGAEVIRAVIILAIVSLVWLPICPWLLHRINMALARRSIREGSNKKVFGQCTLLITPEHLAVIGPGGESKIGWRGVQRIESTDEHIFIYMTSISAIVIPRTSLVGSPFEQVKTALLDHLSKYGG